MNLSDISSYQKDYDINMNNSFDEKSLIPILSQEIFDKT